MKVVNKFIANNHHYLTIRFRSGEKNTIEVNKYTYSLYEIEKDD